MHWILKTASLLLLLLLTSHSATAQTFRGCYEDKGQQRVFTLSPGDYDPELLATESVVCTSRCELLQFDFAGIWMDRFCFCANDINGTDQFNITGHDRTTCNSEMVIAVYNSEKLPTIFDIEVEAVNDRTALQQFQQHELTVNSSQYLALTDVSMRMSYGDDPYRWETIPNSDYATNKSYILPGVLNIRAQAIKNLETAVGSGGLQILISQPIQQPNLTCPPAAITKKETICELTLAGGTNLEAGIDWGDGTVENFTLADLAWERAGWPVATQESAMTSPAPAGSLVMVEAEFKHHGMIHSFEYFANGSGSISLMILRPVCSGATAFYNFAEDACSANWLSSSIIDCATNSESLCPATENCWQAVGGTCKMKMMKKNITRGVHNDYDIVKVYATVNAVNGYNHFAVPEADQVAVKPGDKIGFHSANVIVAARMTQAAEGNDTYKAGSESENATVSAVSLTSIAVQHQISAVAVSNATRKFEKVYEIPANYTPTMTLRNKFLGGSGVTLTQTVWLQPAINTTMFTNQTYIFAFEPSMLILEPHSGMFITYNWTFSDGGTEQTNVPISSYQFAAVGDYNATVTAYTEFQSLSNSTSFRAIQRINITNVTAEAQAIGTTSTISIAMNGSDYSCTFTVSGPEDYNVTVTTNSITLPAMGQVGVYSVNVSCSNPLSQDTGFAVLNVEVPITGFELTTLAAVTNEPFQAGFQITNGTGPKFEALFNNITRSVTFDAGTLKGLVEPITESAVGYYVLVVRAYNNVSDTLLAVNYTLQDRINGLTINVSNPVLQENMLALFAVEMSAGSGVNIEVAFGDGANHTSSMDYLELWNGRTMFANNSFAVSDEYTATVNASNLVSSAVASVIVTVIAPIGDMVLLHAAFGEENVPITFTPVILNGPNPQLTTITIDWNDGSTPFTKYPLRMNHTYQHNFTTLGMYTVNFTAHNPIPSVVSNYSVVGIVKKMVNPRVEFIPPILAKGETAYAVVRVDAGSNITVTLDPGNGDADVTGTIADAPSANTQQTVSKIYTQNGTFTVNVSVCNPARCEYFQHTLVVVNKLQNSTLTLTHTGYEAYPNPVKYTIQYSGASQDLPHGAMVIVRDSAGQTLNVTQLQLPSMEFAYHLPSSQFLNYEFYIYNNGSNLTLTTTRTGSIELITNLNATINYRSAGENNLRNGFGRSGLMFPNKKDIVAIPHVTGFVEFYHLTIEPIPVNQSAIVLLVFNGTDTPFKYEPSIGKYQLTLTAINPLSNMTVNFNISLGGSIVRGRFEDPAGTSQPGQRRQFSCVWDVISEDTCVLVDLGRPDLRFLYGPPTCPDVCGRNDTDGYVMQNTTVLNNRLDFDVLYANRGTYRATALACNDFTVDIVTAAIAVSNSICKPPKVTMVDTGNMVADSPRWSLRAGVTIVECKVIDLPCETTLENKREWMIERVDETNRSVVEFINASSLPTYSNTIFAIPRHFLQVGLYKISVKITMNQTKTIEEFSNSSSMFVQISNSPLIVAFSEGGMTEIRRGVAETICLDPKEFSRDPDVVADDAASHGIDSWGFHCWQQNDTEPSDASRSPSLTPLSGNLSSYNPPATGCFGPSPGFVNASSGRFCFDGRNLRAGGVYHFKARGCKRSRCTISRITLFITSQSPARVDVRCRFKALCRHSDTDPSYHLVNPTDTVQLAGTCNSADSALACQRLQWKIQYYSANAWLEVNSTQVANFVEGSSNFNVSIGPSLFNSLGSSRRCKVCLLAGVGSSNEGEGCVQLLTNTKPVAGACSTNITNATAGVDVFNITCWGFTDDDGIASYQFQLETGASSSTPITVIGYSDEPAFIGAVPYMPPNLTLCVVASDAHAATVKLCFAEIQLWQPSEAQTEKFVNDMLNDNNSPLMKTIYKSNMQETNRGVQSLASLIVAWSRRDIGNLAGSGSVTTAGSGYDEASRNGEQEVLRIEDLPPDKRQQYEESRNKRAKVMGALTDTLQGMTMANSDQIRLVCDTLNVITSGMDDLPRRGQRNAISKSVEATQAIESIANELSQERLNELAAPLLSSLSQCMTAANIQTARGTLSDIEDSMQSEYRLFDTDWESTRPSFPDRTRAEARSAFRVETNSIVQGIVANDVSDFGTASINKVLSIVGSKKTKNEKPTKFTSPQISAFVSKSDPDSLAGQQISAGRSSIKLPDNLCELTKSRMQNESCNGTESQMTVAAYAMPTNPFAMLPSTNPEMPIPTAAEVATINFLDSNGANIPIDSTGAGDFSLDLPKDPTFKEPEYVDPDPENPIPQLPPAREVPGTADGPFSANKKIEQKLMLHEFKLKGNDQSVHFEVEFVNSSSNGRCQLLVVGRLWKPPSLTDPEENFQWWGMLPSNTAHFSSPVSDSEANPFTFTVTNDQFAEAKAQVKKSASDWDRGVNKVLFGVRQLKPEEQNLYTESNKPPVPFESSNQFTCKYKVRIYSASCFSTSSRQSVRKWTTKGCRVGRRTRPKFTECLCSHLTSFAGGWIVAPNAIDWNYVFSNFDFTKNPTLFVTEIVIFVVFTAIFIWARFKDKKDIEKLGVTPLLDNDPDHHYLYEIVVSTGMRRGAGTKSKVHFILSGEKDETDARPLADSKRQILVRGSSDRFLMAVNRPLGLLNYLRIWHDNSGKGDEASWYCNTVVIIDLQTRRRFHFVLNRWLAVDEDDGLVDRIVPVAGLQELKDFSYMFSQHTKKDLTDGHLWVSIMARPPESRFTRVERVACSLFLLFLTMVTSCMFYQQEGASKAASGSLTVGPFALTPRMIYVGVITNIITFLPLFLVMELFRRSRLRQGYVNQLKKAIDTHFEDAEFDDSSPRSKYQVLTQPRQPAAAPESVAAPKQADADADGEDEEEKITIRKPMVFPWWVRIISWMILILGTLTSALFTTFYGIQFGDETCKNWISSLFVSFFASVMLSQPLKVLMVAAAMSLLCKKKNQVDEGEFLDEEEEVLNEIGQRNGLRNDEEWLYDEDEVNRGRNAGMEPPNAELLERARERRLREKKMHDIIREVMFYMIFYLLLLFVTFAFRDPNAFRLKEQMEKLYLPGGLASTGEGIKGVTTEAQFWDWLEQRFVPGLRASTWYNGEEPLPQRGFTGDRVGRLVGYAIMRQKRMKINSCPVQPSVQHLFRQCIDRYNFAEEDKSSYSPKWQLPYNETAANLPQYEAFRHWSSSELKNFPYMARIHTYSAGGYVFQFRGSLQTLLANVRELRTLHWLDKQTRSVFLEFAFYNPNVNLFGIGTVVFEYEGSGGMIGVYRFEAANLMSYLASEVKAFEIACQVLFCLMLIIYIVKEIRKIYKQRKEYFFDIWNISELFILFGSVLSIVAYAYMLYETSRLTSEFKKYGGNVYLNFQFVTFWNEYLVYFTAFIVFVSTLKFIRLLRFNKRMGMLGDVVRLAAKDIRQFFFMFFIIFAAFIQTFYLVFMEQLYGYHTFLHTMEQLMQIALGKFKFLDLYVAEPVIGPLIFSAYTIFIIFILLNMFVAILNEAFAQVKDDVTKQENEHEMVDFVIEKAMMWVGMGNSRVARTYFGHNLADTDYKAHSFEEQVGVALPSRIDSLVDFIEKVYFDEDKRRKKKKAAYRVEELPKIDDANETEEPKEEVVDTLSRPGTAETTLRNSNRDLTEINN